MADLESRLLKLKSKMEDARDTKAKAEGALNAQLQRLKDEYGLADETEADDRVAELQEEIDDLENELEKLLDKLEEEYA